MTLARKGLKKGDRKEEVGKDRRKNTRQKRERRKKEKKKPSTFFAGKGGGKNSKRSTEPEGKRSGFQGR